MLSLNRLTVRILALVLASALVLPSCKKKEEFSEIYEVDAFNAVPNSSGKIKIKTDEQYISVLYANLFQKAISTKLLNDMIDAIYSVGDKEIAHEMILKKFMADPEIKIPTKNEMKADPEKFIKDAYKRFFVRDISEAEKKWFLDYFNNYPQVTPEWVYTSFALSNEYQFY